MTGCLAETRLVFGDRVEGWVALKCWSRCAHDLINWLGEVVEWSMRRYLILISSLIGRAGWFVSLQVPGSGGREKERV